MSTFNELVSRELAFARAKFPPMNSLHEGYAVLLEEMDELWEWIKQKQEITVNEDERRAGYLLPAVMGKRNQAAICEELVQIAAMAQRIFEDIASDGNKVQK